MDPDEIFKWQHAVDVYNIYISYIRHENELIHQRAGRFIAIQAALIATSGLIMQKYFEIASSSTMYVYTEATIPIYLFFVFISVTGIISGISARKSLNAARNAQQALYDAYHDKPPFADNPKRFAMIAYELRLPALMGGGAQSDRHIRSDPDKKGGSFLIYLPVTLIVLWSATLIGTAYIIYYKLL